MRSDAGAEPAAALEVTVYGRPGCHLCEDALAMLERIGRERPLTVTEVDIEADDDLLRRYLERIPVLVIDGVEAFDLLIDERALRAHLLERPEPAR